MIVIRRILLLLMAYSFLESKRRRQRRDNSAGSCGENWRISASRGGDGLPNSRTGTHGFNRSREFVPYHTVYILMLNNKDGSAHLQTTRPLFACEWNVAT